MSTADTETASLWARIKALIPPSLASQERDAFGRLDVCISKLAAAPQAPAPSVAQEPDCRQVLSEVLALARLKCGNLDSDANTVFEKAHQLLATPPSPAQTEVAQGARRNGSVSFEEAQAIARKHAKAEPESYYSEPFEPHLWVINAIIEASAIWYERAVDKRIRRVNAERAPPSPTQGGADEAAKWISRSEPFAIAWFYPDGKPYTLTWAGEDAKRVEGGHIKWTSKPLFLAPPAPAREAKGELPELPEPWTVASTIKCTACGAPYVPQRFVGSPLGSPLAQAHKCKCGSTSFAGSIGYDSPSPAIYTADQMRAYARSASLAGAADGGAE